MALIAIAILLIISYFSISVRSYLAFNCTVIGIGATIAGLTSDEKIFLYLGICVFTVGIAMLYLTSLTRAERSARKRYMLYMWVYGMFIFIKIIIICMVITLPLLALVNAASKSYHTVVVVDKCGNQIGTADIDDYGNDFAGNHYDTYSRY